MIFFVLITCLLDYVLICLGEIIYRSLLEILTHLFQCLVLLAIFVLCFQTKLYLVKQGHTEISPAAWHTNVPPVQTLSPCKEDGRLGLSQWTIVSQVRLVAAVLLLTCMAAKAISFRICGLITQRKFQNCYIAAKDSMLVLTSRFINSICIPGPIRVNFSLLKCVFPRWHQLNVFTRSAPAEYFPRLTPVAYWLGYFRLPSELARLIAFSV